MNDKTKSCEYCCQTCICQMTNHIYTTKSAAEKTNQWQEQRKQGSRSIPQEIQIKIIYQQHFHFFLLSFWGILSVSILKLKIVSINSETVNCQYWLWNLSVSTLKLKIASINSETENCQYRLKLKIVSIDSETNLSVSTLKLNCQYWLWNCKLSVSSLKL